MSSLLNIGASGLKSQQSALNIVGQNITNASTPGYTRQRVDLATQSDGLRGNGLSGLGVQVENTSRIADLFIEDQIRTDASLAGGLEAFSQGIDQVDNLLFDSDIGIDRVLSDFFNALQSAANEPANLSMRQLVLTQANAVTERFGTISQRLDIQQQNSLASINSAVGQANDITQTLAQTNNRIAQLQDSNDSGGLNLLIDRRDNLLKELSSYMGITVAEQADHTVNVFVAKGQPLLLGTLSSDLNVTNTGAISIKVPGNALPQDITGAVNTGEIGGELRFRAEVLNATQNALGHIATVLSSTTNQQHHLGIDLSGDFGADVYRDINDPSLVNQRVSFADLVDRPSATLAEINVYIEQVQDTQASDYEIYFSQNNPGAYSIKRINDGEVVFHGSSLNTPQEIQFDGLRIEFASGTFVPGETLLVQPFKNFAQEISTVLHNAEDLALASPIVFAENDKNVGSAKLLNTRITDQQHPGFTSGNQLTPPLLVRFVTATQYEILDNTDPTRPQPLVPNLGLQEYVPGAQNSLFPAFSESTVVNTDGSAIGRFSPASAVFTSNPVATAANAVNGYGSGSINISRQTDAGEDVQTLQFAANSSARHAASVINQSPGVSASANTVVHLTDLVQHDALATGTPVELVINGETVSGFAGLGELADAINQNSTLSAQGIVAQTDGTTVQLRSTFGDNLTLAFQGDANESLDVLNMHNQVQHLQGSTTGNYASTTVGGEIAVVLDPGVSLTANYSGVFSTTPIASRADFGFDVVLSGTTAPGDEFEVEFNREGIADNRNAQALVDLSNRGLVGAAGLTFAESYGVLIQDIGSKSSQASISAQAAVALLSQSEGFRESVSGVNLDEEAANLIRHEQAYNASAQVITVARDLFNILLNAVS